MLIFFRKHYGHLSLFVTLPIKTAIYGRAFIALVQMLYERMRLSLGFVSKKDQQPVYVFLGREAMLDECRKLAERKGLTARFCTEIPSNEVSDNCCMVYDTEYYGYEKIIEMASTHQRRLSSIATYSTKNHILITPREIIR
jgi:hypothetical protein